MRNTKKGQKMKLTKIAAVTLSAALIFGCDDLEFKETTTNDDGSVETDTGTDTGSETTANLFASITDTSTDTSGNLRYTLADDDQIDLTTGALSVDVLYPTGQDQDFSIGLYDDSSSTSNMVADIILKSDGRIQTRIDGSGTTLNVTHTPGTETNFTVTWDAATTTYTAFMDDVEIFSGDFNNTDATAVASFGVKLASNTKVAAGTSTVDNIKIYSDTTMSTLVFEDNFEEFILGDDLAGGAAVYYSGAEAVIGGVEASDETDTDTEVTNSTQVAAIADTLGDDTGELRYSISSAIAVGQVNISFLYDESETEAAFLTVFSDGGTSTSSGQHIADLRIDEGDISLRNHEGTLATFTPGKWVDIQVNWVTNGTGSADVTLTVDGVELSDTYTSTYSAGENDAGAKDIQIRYAGGSATTEFSLYADDLAIYSDAGTTEVFSDDFESYGLDTLLDSDVDGLDDTDYHKNSSEATVAAQPTVAE